MPKHKRYGRHRVVDRTTIDAIIFVLVTAGCRCADLLEEHELKSTTHRRFQDLQETEIWKNIFKSAVRLAYRQGKLGMKKITIDSTTIPNKKGGNMIGYDGNKKITGTKYTQQCQMDWQWVLQQFYKQFLIPKNLLKRWSPFWIS